MVWFVTALELKSKDGGGSGKYRLCAESDEDGGFHPLCSHEHGSRVEAYDCPDAIERERQVTGFARRVRDLRSYGQIGYEAYRNHTGGVSLASGHPIPEWTELPEAIRQAWEVAAKAAIEAV